MEHVSRFSRHRYSGLLTASIVLLSAGLASEAHTASWNVKSEVGVGARYESNPRMQRQDKRDALGTVVNAGVDIVAATAQTTFILNPRVRLNFYPDKIDSDLENNDQYIDFSIQHQTAKSVYSLTANYSDVGIRTSELGGEDDTGQPPPGDDSGSLAFIDQTKEYWSISPFWSYQLSPRNQIQTFATYSDITFKTEGQGVSNLFDYKTTSAGLTLQHMLDEGNTVSVELTGSKFTSETPATRLENNTDSLGANLIYTHVFSPNLDVTAKVGAQNSKFDVSGFFPDLETGNPFTDQNPFFPTPAFMCTDPPDQNFLPFNFVPCTRSDSDTNMLFELSARKRSQRTDVDISLSQSISPNSNGSTVVRDSLWLFLRHRLSDRFTGIIGVNAYRQTDVGELTDRRRNFARASVSLRWRWSRHWLLSGRYAFIIDNQKENIFFRGINGSAENNLVYIGIEYRGLDHQ